MTTEQIIQTLIENKNYDKIQTERLSSKIEALPADIRAALVKWVESGDLSSPEYSGYTVDKILSTKPGMTILAAFLSLDWIRRDPQTAIKAISMPLMKSTPYAKP